VIDVPSRYQVGVNRQRGNVLAFWLMVKMPKKIVPIGFAQD